MHLLRAGLLLCLLLTNLAAAEPLKSGPPVGEELQKSFEPVNLTGPDAGEKTCILCEYGEAPVVLVFARAVNDPLLRLIKRLDAVTAQHRERGLASTVILLSDDASAAKRLKQFAEQEKIQHTILRRFAATGPKDYRLAPEAEITAILFLDRFIKATHALKAGELQEKSAEAIIADVAKVLPARK
ncbi:MAG: hypothetical protein JNM56_13915 [Planctomycetia bacterium]|nr:hypothetical protein [Planctomycetia bacterium]